MMQDSDWDAIRGDRGLLVGGAGMTTLGIALLFGSVAVALALFIAPFAERYSRQQFAVPGGVDLINTGSIGGGDHYTIRRSVLQDSPDSICIIRANGTRAGDC